MPDVGLEFMVAGGLANLILIMILTFKLLYTRATGLNSVVQITTLIMSAFSLYVLISFALMKSDA